MFGSRRYTLLAAAAAAAVVGLAPASAHAVSKGPCIAGQPSPRCFIWKAKTVFVADGDTIRVRIQGQRGIKTIRFTGINAMELHRYSSKASRRRGDCHGLEATNLVERLIRRSHGIVRLLAQHPSSSTGGRLRRDVQVRIGGRWQDLDRIEMEQGQALWLPNAREYAWNHEFHQLAERAWLEHENLYNPAYCRPGPNQDIPIKLLVNWDADGNDNSNRNGEWAVIQNQGSRDLPLGGWWFRDSWLQYSHTRPNVPGFRFPAGTTVPAGGSIKLHMGCGAATAHDLYWCDHRAVFENVSYDRRNMGDGGYLFDPDGDLRALMMYPCISTCDTSMSGKLVLSAHPNRPEAIGITNASSGPLDLNGYILKLHNRNSATQFIWGYPFTQSTVLQAGETMLVFPQGSPAGNAHLVRYLGSPRDRVLADGGGAVSLRSFDDFLVDCVRWGSGSCGSGQGHRSAPLSLEVSGQEIPSP